MKILKWLGIVFAAIVAVVGLSLVWLTNTRPDFSEFDAYYAPPATSAVTVRFVGTSTMLFSDGETEIMIDGWFTRPSNLAMVFGEIAPDAAAIDYGLARLGDPQPAALVVTHSHMDHAMDVAEVARRTGSLLVGSESTANIGRGGGLAEDRIQVVADGDRLGFGAFDVTMIESGHFVPASDTFQEADLVIDAPLAPPASAWAYHQGEYYSVLIEHPDGSALIHCSPGFREGSLHGIDVDAVYLGVGFVTAQTDDYQDAWWREVVTTTRPEGIYLIHWDGFSKPLADQGEFPAPPIRLWNDAFGMAADDGIRLALRRAEAADVSAALLPLWQETDAFAVRVRSPDATAP